MAAKKAAPVKKEVEVEVKEEAMEEAKVQEDTEVVVPDVKVDTNIEVKDEELNIAKADKMVKVATSRNHKCVVGGKTYYFEAGKQVNVPFNVKAILKNAGVLAAF